MSLADILRDSGVRVQEEPGWQTRRRPGTFGPIHGIINHHTGGRGGSLSVCVNGRQDLAGPLCHIMLDRGGVAHLISDGRANHAGLGSGAALSRVIAGLPPVIPGPDNADGNASFYGIEVENDGLGEPYPQVQTDALVAINAAICRAKSWNENHCIHHKEWTRRKVDMSWTGDLRALVAQHLRDGSTAPAAPALTTTITNFPGDHMHRIDNPARKQDDHGNSWYEIPNQDAMKVINVVPLGSYPPDDGYWNLPVWGRQQRGTSTIITLTEADPNATELISVWVAD